METQNKVWTITTLVICFTVLAVMFYLPQQASSPEAVEATPDMQKTRLASLEQTISAVETPVRELYDLAMNIATQCAQPAVPTATATPDALCKLCALAADCPAGYVCRDCYSSLGYRCVRKESPNADCQRCLQLLVSSDCGD